MVWDDIVANIMTAPALKAISMAGLGIGIFVLLIALMSWHQDRLVRSYLMTPGTIISSEFKKIERLTSSATATPSTYAFFLNLVVSYSYQVNGVTYAGSVISNDSLVGSELFKTETPIAGSPLFELSNRFFKGEVVPVYYEPRDPQHSLLLIRGPITTMVLAAISLLTLFIGTLALYNYFKIRGTA